MLLSVILLTSICAPISAQQIQGARDNSQVYSGVVYGPIDQNDTLWKIASRYKQDSRFSVYQTMLAIFELNPQAFENGNFNTMVNGATLQLPSDRYIARTDLQKARAKAATDDRAFGRNNSTREPSTNADANLKPAVPLVNQEDLSKSQSQLQSQLNTLRRQQQQQFEQLKNQVAASIDSVEVLLQENKKLNERLFQIDENNRSLTQTVETELQTQIDQQVDQLAQLIELFKRSEERRIEEESQSILKILSSPTALILLSTGLTIIVLVGLAIFLLRKPSATQAANKQETKQTEDIVDDDLVIGEADNLDTDSDDLMAALESESVEDDILSDDLEDDDAISSLSDDDLLASLDLDDDDLNETFDEIDATDESTPDDSLITDDMLVPDSPSEHANTTDIADVLDEIEDNDFDLDAIALDDEAEAEDIDLSGLDIDSTDEQSASKLPPKRTKRKDNALSDDESGSPEGIDLDEDGNIDEQTIDQIEQQISEKDENISRLADELLEEINTKPELDVSVDDLLDSDGLEKDSDSEDELPLDNEPETDDSTVIDEQADSSNKLDDSAPEALSPIEEQADTSAQLDDLLDNIELEATDTVDEVKGSESADEKSITQDDAESDLDVSEDDLKESSLNEDILDLSDDNDTDGLNKIDNGSDDQVSALADEILQDLEAQDDISDELDSLLDELTHDMSLDDTKAINDDELDFQSIEPDEDDLLDDIPSFTSDLVEDEEEAPETPIQDTEVKPATEIKPAAQEKPESMPEPQALKADSNNTDLEKTLDEDDSDVLSALPDLDDWLDEDDKALDSPSEEHQTQDNEAEIDFSALELDDESQDTHFSNDEDELIAGLDDVDFDDMLNDLSTDDDFLTSQTLDSAPSDAEQPSTEPLDSNKASQKSTDPLEQAGLDLESLMTDENKLESDEDSFLNVDDLLRDSDAMPEMADNELDLNLENSLDKLVPAKKPTQPADDFDSDQASNLDLAQVYIDMEDFEAAQELLDEVVEKGNAEQQTEANTLLSSFKR